MARDIFRVPSCMYIMVRSSDPAPASILGFSVHHDPVDGIFANPGNREWARRPLSFFVVCEHPIHRVMVNWDPPMAAAAAIKFY